MELTFKKKDEGTTFEEGSDGVSIICATYNFLKLKGKKRVCLGIEFRTQNQEVVGLNPLFGKIFS